MLVNKMHSKGDNGWGDVWVEFSVLKVQFYYFYIEWPPSSTN